MSSCGGEAHSIFWAFLFLFLTILGNKYVSKHYDKSLINLKAINSMKRYQERKCIGRTSLQISEDIFNKDIKLVEEVMYRNN